MNIHILLADDHTILRAGLKMMLNAQPDMDVVGEAQDGRQAISEALRMQGVQAVLTHLEQILRGVDAGVGRPRDGAGQ